MTDVLIACLLTAIWTTAEAPPAPVGGALPTQKQVTAHLDDLYRSKSSHAKLKMAVTTEYFSRTLSLESWSLGDDESLIVIRSPAREAGTATLRTEKGLWNYAPRADRLMRIPSALLSDGWMGSHFTNDDLMRENSWEEDYDTKVAWTEEGGASLLRLEMMPKADAAVVYSKVVMLLSRDGWLPVRTDYYDGDEVVRSMAFSKVKTFGARKIPSVMVVTPTDKPKEKTVMTYDEMHFDIEVKKSMFTPRGLRKAALGR